MDDWQKELWLMIETATVEVEQFFEDVGQVIEAFVEQFQDEITVEVEQFFDDLLSPFIEDHDADSPSSSHFSPPWNEEDLEDLLNPKVEPSAENYPACVGCRHYHGRLYGGNLLICGMHPYGWEDEHCPDWEELMNNEE